ncbi:unnamed protein product [Fusarium graminearum]|nr:unnamed protein product [Fusarium graminearum]
MRETFLRRDDKLHLKEEDFQLFGDNICELCHILDRAVNPAVTKIAGNDKEYPRLSGAAQFLQQLNPGDNAHFDLVSGPGDALFILSDDMKTKVTESVKVNNRLVAKALGSCFEEETNHLPRRRNTDSWAKSKVRDQTSTLLRVLFKRFTCRASHKLLMDFGSMRPGKYDASTMRLHLSTCPSHSNHDNWQAMQYRLGNQPSCEKEILDLCSEISAMSLLDQELCLLCHKDQLLGAWAPNIVAHTTLDPLEKQSLAERITSGMFKPPTASYHIAQMAGTEMSTQRYDLKRKRVLAVEMGYCLLNFFDASFDPNDICFFGKPNKNGLRESCFRSFSSKLPTSPDLRSFQIGHPVLLSFAKVLLELDDGEEIPIKICPEYQRNELAWMQLLSAVQKRVEGADVSYPKAVRGCLNVHSQLQHINTESIDSDTVIRDKLFHHIVQHLEDSLESCLSLGDTGRKRQIQLNTDSSGSLDVLNQSCGALLEESGINLPSPSGKRIRMDQQHRSEFCDHHNRLQSIADTLSNRPMGNNIDKDLVQSVTNESQNPMTGNFTDRTCPPKGRNDFEVAIICALPLEFDAIRTLFDRHWEERHYRFRKLKGDPNHYVNGRIGTVDVVVLLLSEMGKVSAASAAACLKLSYPELQMVFLSGVCGGIPTLQTETIKQEVLLGDVIVSSNMIQYDFGRRYQEVFTIKQSSQPAKRHIQNILVHFETDSFLSEVHERCTHILEEIQEKNTKYNYPGTSEDRLFEAKYKHLYANKEPCTCCKTTHTPCTLSITLPCEEAGCDYKYLVERKRLEKKRDFEDNGLIQEAQKPSIFLGKFGSADTVMKSSKDRDMLVSQHSISALEMEGAGMWDDVPCIIVKGVCDYADSHKNKVWQDFASATAAAVVKALLERYIQTSV